MNTSFWLSLPDPVAELPTTLCGQCGRHKLNGLFSPEQLQQDAPICLSCKGELTSKPLWKRKSRPEPCVFNRKLTKNQRGE